MRRWITRVSGDRAAQTSLPAGHSAMSIDWPGNVGCGQVGEGRELLVGPPTAAGSTAELSRGADGACDSSKQKRTRQHVH
jgi:hypothetical protein